MKTITLKPNCRPVLVGSLPISDHQQAMEMILEHTPEVPLWPQLPVYKEEGMVAQFLSGMPGQDECDNKIFINPNLSTFDEELLAFYEEYLMITEAEGDLDNSRFTMSIESARGFHTFLATIPQLKNDVTALKGQITGPFTFTTGLVDQDNRAIVYNDQLRDAAIKLIALKAKWQAKAMKQLCSEAIVVFDEPALAGFGSSAFITIGHNDIKDYLSEVFSTVHQEGAMVGVHVCANTEWSILFDAGLDLVSFDAYSFFDKFILYPDYIKSFLQRGGILASGIVPTTPEHIDKENTSSLVKKWHEQASLLVEQGISMETIASQTFITPSCGTGSLSIEHATKVLELTKEVSAKIREDLSIS